MADSQHERTEKPTHRKKEKARRRGDVVRSNELQAAVMLLSGTVLLKFMGPWMKEQILERFTWGLGDGALVPITSETIPGLAASWLAWSGQLLAPLFVILTAIGIGVNVLIMGGVTISSEAIGFRPERLNPFSGAGRLFSRQALFKLAGDSVKLCLVGFVCFKAVRGFVPVLFELGETEPGRLLSQVSGFTLSILFKAGAILVLIGLVDYAYRRRRRDQELMMSKRELKDEMKESEGDPLIRGRLRSMRNELFRRRMMHAVPKATVVLTNPTEIAVALRYDPETMSAPRVVAKGKRLIAQRIRAIAEEHQVPVVENPPLARSLYKMVSIGDEIPAKLYRAVAEVLSYVYRMQGRRRPEAG